MESPVLENSTVVQKQSRKKLYLAAALAFFILAIGFLLIVVFTYGKSNVKSPEPTFNDQEPIVSAPGIAVGEPNPNTPIPVESELTYTFPEAYGFNVTYTAADWTVKKEPTKVYDYTPGSFGYDGTDLLDLQSTLDPDVDIQIYFTKAVSGTLTGNPLQVCGDEYKIVKEQSSTGANDGLIRLFQGDSGTLIYSNSYHPGNNNELCVYNSHPIYKLEKVDGGQNPNVPDTNDIYWIASVYTRKGNSQLSEIDKIVSTIKFAE